MPPVDPGQLPATLIERFAGDDADRLVALLRSSPPSLEAASTLDNGFANPQRTLVASHPVLLLQLLLSTEERRHDTTRRGVPSSRAVGAPALLRHRTAVGGASRQRRLKAAIEGLAGRTWQHPTTGEPHPLRLLHHRALDYRARKEKRNDPVGMLRRRVRANAGRRHAISDAARRAVFAQNTAHEGWSVQLHRDDLVALAETKPELKPVPSCPTLRRFMKADGLDKRRRVTSRRPTTPIAPGQARRSRRSAATRPSTLAACGIGLSIKNAHRARRVGDADPVRHAR